MTKIRTWLSYKTLLETWGLITFVQELLAKPESKKELIAEWMKEYYQVLEILTREENNLLTDAKKEVQNNIKRLQDRVEEIPLVLINQNLVMMCTVLEIFLVDVLNTILLKEPRTLLILASEKEATLKDVIHAEDKEELLEYFRRKTVKEFSRQSIKNMFKVFKRIGIESKAVFALPFFKPVTKQDKSPLGLDDLVGIFDKRHDVVHKRLLPIKDPIELRDIMNFFGTLIFSLSFVVRSKFGVEVDLSDQNSG